MNNFTHFRPKNIPVISTVFKTFSCHELTFTIVPKPPDIIAEEIPEVKQDLKINLNRGQKLKFCVSYKKNPKITHVVRIELSCGTTMVNQVMHLY